ncbi:MAG: FAD-dependent oxidoreductase [Actinomycetota bacterium]|nr:FAD-dependent oxidoreductase [Actinomycetota bacterium]
MPSRTVVVGAGGAGMGAAGQAKAIDPDGEIMVFTEFEDAAYSPCGIPYVHGKEIPDFERLFLATKEHYQEQGIDVHYQTRVESLDVAAKTIDVAGQGRVTYDNLVLATGWNYADPGVPGGDLDGLYYVKNIRQAMEWDKVLDTVKVAVVVEAGPLGLEMTTALAHRGIETHLIDSHPWSLSEAADPDIVEPVEQSWAEMGVKMHFNCELGEFSGGNGKLRAVQTSDGEIPCDLAVISTHKVPNNQLAQAAGITLGSTGGIVIDERMATSAPHVWAAGDCCEVVHGVNGVPLQGLSGSHAYAQGKVAGTNAAGGDRRYQPVYVPWGMVAGKWMIGGVAYGETLATALGLPFISGVGNGISRARYYPGVKTLRVKLLAEPDTLRLIGAQMVGQEGIKERADFLAMAVKTGITLEDLATMENVYSPPIGALGEPIATAALAALASRR